MISPVVSAGIITTYKCNSRCRHCLYACGPEWRDFISIEDGQRILRGMIASAGRVRGVHFAGGEAFLDFGTLLELVKTAVELGMPIDYVETNAGWCVDESSSLEKMRELKRAGLNCLLISASPFHAEYIPPERTLRGVRLASEVFGHYGVIVWLPEFLRQIIDICTDGVIPWDEYIQKHGDRAASQAAAYGGAMVPGGRAGVRLKDHMPLYPAERFTSQSCRSELLHSGHGHFDLYGNYIPASCTGIALKDARDLPDLIENFDPSQFEIIHILSERGLGSLMEMAGERYGFRASSEGYAGKCHLCLDIRRHIALHTDDHPELSPREFYRQV